jgi:glycosyltransferase involved in cell wall biosynthesis
MYPCPERPGFGPFVWHQAEQLRKLGHAVDVIRIPGFRSRRHYVTAALDVRRQTRNGTYDIVHAHYGLSAYPAWFRVRLPLVLTLHGSDVLGTRMQRCLSRAISQVADAVIVVSEEIGRRIPGIVIPCGVDMDVFRPHSRAEARARLGWPGDRRIVLFPFDPARRVKRHDLALAAVAELRRERVDVDLVPVFNVPNPEMPWYYSAADVMLMCSDREGSPTSIKEALACNLPVVATDVGDVRELTKGVVGARVCTQEVGDIARKLSEAIDVSRTGVVDGRTAMTRYDQSQTIQKVLRVYEAVLRGQGRPWGQ